MSRNMSIVNIWKMTTAEHGKMQQDYNEHSFWYFENN